MTRRIARMAVVLAAGFAVLLVQLTNIGQFSSASLRDHELNQRAAMFAIGRTRGAITTADGETIAQGIGLEQLGDNQLRTYPHGALYAHVAGYLSPDAGATGLERSYNDELSGNAADIALQDVSDLFDDSDRVGDLVVSVHHGVQLTARAALGDRDGAVVVIEPQTGAVIALWSRPSFDPNAVVGMAPDSDASFPLPTLARAYRQHYVLTGSDLTGADTLAATAAALLEGAARGPDSTGIDLPGEPGRGAARLVGEGVALTPLQLAVAAAAVANAGVGMQPHLVSNIGVRAAALPSGDALPASIAASAGTAPLAVARYFSAPQAASLLADMTATAQQAEVWITAGEGVEFAAALATGRVGASSAGSGAQGNWAVLLAPADAPTVAVTVLIEPDPASEAAFDLGDPVRGGTLATMIAANAAEAALALRAVPTRVDDGP